MRGAMLFVMFFACLVAGVNSDHFTQIAAAIVAAGFAIAFGISYHGKGFPDD